MTLKRFLSIIAAASITLSFTACDDDNDKKDDTTQQQPDDNTGKCDPECTDGKVCKDGTCQDVDTGKCDPACTDGKVCKDGTCQDVDTGKCDPECTDGKVCKDGTCQDAGTDTGSQDTEAAAKALNEAEPFLQSCDFKSASEKLDVAYNANKADASIAFQRSILGILNLVNNANIQSVLKDFGFTGSPIDFSVVMQADGIFKQMVTKDKNWGSIADKLPHPAIKSESFSEFVDKLSNSLSTASVLKALNNMDNDLLSLAESLETAAKGLQGNQLIAIDKAGCSLNEIKFGAADLYFMAALIRGLMAGVDWASAYDFDISMKKYFDHDKNVNIDDYKTLEAAQKACTSYLNDIKFITDHLFQVKAADAGKDGRKHLVAAAVDVKAAAEAAPSMDKKAFFGWSVLASGALKDIKDIAQSVIDSEDGSKPITISQISPALKIDLTKLFDKAIAPSKKLEGRCDIEQICKEYTDDFSACKTVDVYYLDAYRVDDGLLNAFFGEDILNTISGAKVYSYALDTKCESAYKEEAIQPANTIKLLCSSGKYAPEYSHSFSSSWEDFDLDRLIDPNNYFGGEEDSDSSH